MKGAKKWPETWTAAKGMAALHLSRKLNVQYKTDYVLLQKLREAVGLRRSAITLQGLVQIDGKYVGGVLRKANKKASARTQQFEYEQRTQVGLPSVSGQRMKQKAL